MDQVLKDSHGRKLGSIKQEGNRQILKDSRGRRLGSYDLKDNITRDSSGRRVGTGNLLTTLLTP
ncbi:MULTISPECIES: hypothetical protein [Enterococcus]|uniref:hypothetical protein n=1 Tax=Enterococcus TaxID=1350 RepID=UPI0022DF9141|nr:MULTISPECIES: hypothetical protein [Enterococcus]